MGKSIKKLVKKFSSHSILGKDKEKNPAPVQPAAAAVEAPKEDNVEDTNANTESARKAARRGGKWSLSVSRSSGSGLNI